MSTERASECSLSTLLRGDGKIVIPDLQRDYCWGGLEVELVSGFVSNLMEQYRPGASDELTLGVIYGYEQPRGQLQLCDGQQRVTTLYLLLGMLNRLSGCDAFRELLISDFELERDDREPYLQYAIRESSLYFLSDLVCHFFIEGSPGGVEEIRGCAWYFNDYREDPSVESMLLALGTMECLLSDKSSEWCVGFGRWLTTGLHFLCCDLGDRRNGEETFVVINTTGEPLSVAENLKPLVCGAAINADYARGHNIYAEWEELEHWFWRRRNKDVNDTGDAGMREFLRWVTIICADQAARPELLRSGSCKLPHEAISFARIRSLWRALRFLYETWGCRGELDAAWLSPEKSAITQVECFRLLPLLAYCERWQVGDADDLSLLRFHRFIDNLSHVSNVRNSAGDMVGDALVIAAACRDIVELVGRDLGVSKTLLSEEEQLKLTILSRDVSCRAAIEQAFWRAQGFEEPSHRIWSGQIMPLLQWATADGGFSLGAFERYLKIFDETFAGDCDENIDAVRRALLTRGLEGYPRIFTGNSVYSLGWDWSDWQRLISDNMGQFRAFFDALLSGDTLQGMIDAYPVDQPWADLVHDPRLIAYCGEKKLQMACNGWYLMQKERFSGQFAFLRTYRYYLHLQDAAAVPDGWTLGFYGRELSCVYYDHARAGLPGVAVDVCWNGGDQHDRLQIDLFDRGEDAASRRAGLRSVADELGYEWTDDSDGRYRKHLDTGGHDERQLTSWADNECEQLFRLIP